PDRPGRAIIMKLFRHPAFPIGHAAILFVTLLFNGCSWVRPAVTKTPPPIEASAAPSVSEPTPGSLWNDNGEIARLYSDNRASRIGDIVTIRITENASGTKTATTKTAKDSTADSSFSGNFNSFFGLPARVLGFLSPSAS